MNLEIVRYAGMKRIVLVSKLQVGGWKKNGRIRSDPRKGVEGRQGFGEIPGMECGRIQGVY